MALAPNGTTIEGLYSDGGDHIGFLSPVNALAPVEQWFAGLEEAMVTSLRYQLKNALVTKGVDGSDLHKWLGQHPAQCVMTAAMILWCSKTEAALDTVNRQGEFRALEECLEDSNNEIKQ